MGKLNPRRPTIRVDGPVFDADTVDGWDLAKWTASYTKFAGEHGVDVEDVRLDVTTEYGYDNDTTTFFKLVFFREKTREEELAEKQAAEDAENAERERVRKQIEFLAEKYPDLMPFQVQELP